MPTVSVITPCFNYAQFLGETLECLLRQTYADWECVIVDDGSTDASPEVARRYQAQDRRIRYVRQENRGLPAARNTGLRESSGRYVFFLDADDLIHPDALGWLIAAMENSSRRVALMQARNFYRDPAADSFPFESRPRAAAFLPNVLADNLAPVHCYLAERAMVLAAGGFDERLHACEDWDLWIRVALQGAELAHVDRVGAYYRRHATSMSTSKFRMWEAALRVRWKAFHQVTSGDGRAFLPPSVLSDCRQTIATNLKRDWIRLSAKLARHGEPALSKRFFELARDSRILGNAHVYPGEMWARYLLHRVTRPCRPPTPKELDQLCALESEMRNILTAGDACRPHFFRRQTAPNVRPVVSDRETRSDR